MSAITRANTDLILHLTAFMLIALSHPTVQRNTLSKLLVQLGQYCTMAVSSSDKNPLTKICTTENVEVNLSCLPVKSILEESTMQT